MLSLTQMCTIWEKQSFINISIVSLSSSKFKQMQFQRDVWLNLTWVLRTILKSCRTYPLDPISNIKKLYKFSYEVFCTEILNLASYKWRWQKAMPTLRQWYGVHNSVLLKMLDSNLKNILVMDVMIYQRRLIH